MEERVDLLLQKNPCACCALFLEGRCEGARSYKYLFDANGIPARIFS
jgi:hypothetical protein